MIEKLKGIERDYGTYTATELTSSNSDMFCKINELVDVVNSIISVQEKLIDSRFVVETKHEEPADPYEEQRKWIGKLCRFWDKDYEDCIYDILHHIDPNSFYKYCRRELGGGYSHCEPVSEDLIYKGE